MMPTSDNKEIIMNKTTPNSDNPYRINIDTYFGALMAISNSIAGGFGSIENRIDQFNLLLWMSILLIVIGIASLVTSIYEEHVEES